MHPTSIQAVRFSLIALKGTVERLFKHAENSVLIFLAQWVLYPSAWGKEVIVSSELQNLYLDPGRRESGSHAWRQRSAASHVAAGLSSSESQMVVSFSRDPDGRSCPRSPLASTSGHNQGEHRRPSIPKVGLLPAVGLGPRILVLNGQCKFTWL